MHLRQVSLALAFAEQILMMMASLQRRAFLSHVRMSRLPRQTEAFVQCVYRLCNADIYQTKLSRADHAPEVRGILHTTDAFKVCSALDLYSATQGFSHWKLLKYLMHQLTQGLRAKGAKNASPCPLRCVCRSMGSLRSLGAQHVRSRRIAKPDLHQGNWSCCQPSGHTCRAVST